MNLSMNLIFCTWLGIRKIHLYGLVHFYGCGQAHLDMPKVITLWWWFFCIWLGIHWNSKLIQLFQTVQQSGSWALPQKFSLRIRLLEYLGIFCTTIQCHLWNQLNKFWSLMGSGILCRYLLKSSLFYLTMMN